MELLERYLGQIKKHLPIKDREDTLNELRSLLCYGNKLTSLDISNNTAIERLMLHNMPTLHQVCVLR